MQLPQAHAPTQTEIYVYMLINGKFLNVHFGSGGGEKADATASTAVRPWKGNETAEKVLSQGDGPEK